MLSGLLAASSAALLAQGCASDDRFGLELTELQQYVSGANHCLVASECTVVAARCPLGCDVAVRLDRAEEAAQKIREWTADEEAKHPRRPEDMYYCDAGCPQVDRVVCYDRRCGLVYE